MSLSSSLCCPPLLPVLPLLVWPLVGVGQQHQLLGGAESVLDILEVPPRGPTLHNEPLEIRRLPRCQTHDLGDHDLGDHDEALLVVHLGAGRRRRDVRRHGDVAIAIAAAACHCVVTVVQLTVVLRCTVVLGPKRLLTMVVMEEIVVMVMVVVMVVVVVVVTLLEDEEGEGGNGEKEEDDEEDENI